MVEPPEDVARIGGYPVRFESDDRKPRRNPRIEPSEQGPNPGDSVPFEHQRHPGAFGLIGSGAIEGDVAIA
jgi:hypothetical protein